MPTYKRKNAKWFPSESEVESFPDMIGKTLVSIDDLKVGSESVEFKAQDGTKFVFWYEHDCCASCVVQDLIGDVSDLIGTPILVAEEVSSKEAPKPEGEYVDSYTWTFYRFSTAKGTVTVRWLGESNGHYSESVSYRVVEPKP